MAQREPLLEFDIEDAQNSDVSGDTAPFSEPEIVHELFLDGVTISRTPTGGIRAVGWQSVLGPDGKIAERRIVVRAALPPWSLLKTHASFRLQWPSFSRLWSRDRGKERDN